MELRIPELATGAAEAFGPFRTYLLTRGLVVSFDGVEAVVADGVGSSISFPISSEPDEGGLFPNEVYVRHLDEVQNRIGVKFVGFQGASDDGAFRIGDYAFSARRLGETLLERLSKLETLIRNRVLKKGGIAEVEIMAGMAICANIEEDVSHGRVGIAGVELLIDALKKTPAPITEAYFIFNATSIAEDLRYALQAACHHFRNLNLGIRKLNETPASALATTELVDESWERRIYSTEVDELSYAYTSSVVSCYTALDLLYLYFIYLTREPFLDPAFPSKLHFPDASRRRGREIFQEGGGPLPNDPPVKDLPYAIANLKAGQFASLRHVRNSLVHNMATDSLRPRVYLGRKLPPVNNEPLQYVQYLARDIDSRGKPVAHSWVRRFYENQSDAQNSLLDWLELTWQCSFDTIEWLIKRWSNHLPDTDTAV